MARPLKRRLSLARDAADGRLLFSDLVSNVIIESPALASLLQAMCALGKGRPLSAYLDHAKRIERRTRRPNGKRDRFAADVARAALVEELHRHGIAFNDNGQPPPHDAPGAYVLAAEQLGDPSEFKAKRAHDKLRHLFEAADYGPIKPGKRRAGFSRQKTHMTG